MATRADDNGPFKEFVFDDWLREAAKGIRGEVEGRRIHFDTSEFRMHMRNARKEQLLAIRSLIDSALTCLSKE
jgi:hypothetical protein